MLRKVGLSDKENKQITKYLLLTNLLTRGSANENNVTLETMTNFSKTASNQDKTA